MYSSIVNEESKIAIIGLGYVGLPIALEFAKKVSVIGFDISASRVEMMKHGKDPSNELEKKDFEGCDIVFTDQLEDLKAAKFFIVAVPTPVDAHNVPDLKPVQRASETIGKVIKKGDYVVFESTVYPGCTEEDCLPIIEKLSGLKAVEDFKIGYSPERINPGDKTHTLATIVKVVSGCDAESAEDGDLVGRVCRRYAGLAWRGHQSRHLATGRRGGLRAWSPALAGADRRFRTGAQAVRTARCCE